jgi:TonB family protein
MNRVQKKCLIVSTGLHLLLAVMLVFGPAFLISRSVEKAPPLLDFVAGATVDAVLSGGGDSSVKTPTAELVTPPAPTPPTAVVTPPVPVPPTPIERTPPPQPERDLTPVPKNPPRENTAKSDIPSVKPAPPKHQINVDTTLKTTSTADIKAKRDAQAKAVAAEQQRIASALGHAKAGIRDGVSGSTEIRLKGPGGGGVTYGNIKSAIYTKYHDAWQVPDGVPDLTVYVSITLARDGTVVSARITDRSGNAQLDNSVQKVLDRVKFIAPLPDGETQDTREFNFGFNPDMKLSG